ncbi:MAG: nucleotide pyrophosphohydrolase [Sulfuriferula sp.]|nr:nucleotide pyrophosphohydrolase [Sulfuriferula sp.]
MDMVALQQKLVEFADERDWDVFHTPKNLAMALAGEAGELLAEFQWLTAAQSSALSVEQHTVIKYEMADVLLYLLRLADKLDVDLEQAAIEKIALNAQKYPVDLAKGNALKYNKLGGETGGC